MPCGFDKSLDLIAQQLVIHLLRRAQDHPDQANQDRPGQAIPETARQLRYCEALAPEVRERIHLLRRLAKYLGPAHTLKKNLAESQKAPGTAILPKDGFDFDIQPHKRSSKSRD